MKNIKRIAIVGLVVYLLLLSFLINVNIAPSSAKPSNQVELVIEEVETPQFDMMYTWDDGTEDCY